MSASRLGLPSYSTIDHGQTIRPSATSLLTIDSDDRFKDYPTAIADVSSIRDYNVSSYNFKIQKSESMIASPPTRLAVTEAMFQWTIPNINRRTCQILCSFIVSGSPLAPPVLITLNQGFYTPSALAAAMQTAVRGIGLGLSAFTMTYGTLDGADQPLFVYNTHSPTIAVSFDPLPAPPASQKQLFHVLGFFSQNRILSLSTANLDISSGLTFCQAISYVDIVCTQLTALQTIRDTTSQSIRRDALCRLYITNPSDVSNVRCSNSAFCPPGCAPMTIYRDFATPKQIFWVPNQPVGGSLEFIVYSDDGTPLSESDSFTSVNYTNWAITLLLSEN